MGDENDFDDDDFSDDGDEENEDGVGTVQEDEVEWETATMVKKEEGADDMPSLEIKEGGERPHTLVKQEPGFVKPEPGVKAEGGAFLSTSSMSSSSFMQPGPATEWSVQGHLTSHQIAQRSLDSHKMDNMNAAVDVAALKAKSTVKNDAASKQRRAKLRKAQQQWYVRAAKKNPWLDPRHKPDPRDFVESQGIIPELQNVVSTVKLGCRLDLRKIAMALPNVEFDNGKRRTGAVVRCRIKDEEFPSSKMLRATITIFSTGQMRCMGLRNEYYSLKASRRVARKVQKLGYPVVFRDFRVSGLTATVDIKFPIYNLEKLSLENEDELCSEYEPDFFSGVKFKLDDPELTAQVFASGKITFLGAKTREDIYTAFKRLYGVLREFQQRQFVEEKNKQARLEREALIAASSSSRSSSSNNFITTNSSSLSHTATHTSSSSHSLPYSQPSYNSNQSQWGNQPIPLTSPYIQGGLFGTGLNGVAKRG